MLSRRKLIQAGIGGLAVLGAAGLLSADRASAQESLIYTGIVKGVAVGGYDPVAYFTDGKPVQGKPEFALDHGGAKWLFATAANRDAFKAEPAKFEPQYGGHCAFAVASGYTAKGDPQAWTIANGKLYLNYNQSVKKGWEADIPGFVKKGDASWPALAKKKS